MLSEGQCPWDTSHRPEDLRIATSMKPKAEVGSGLYDQFNCSLLGLLLDIGDDAKSH